MKLLWGKEFHFQDLVDTPIPANLHFQLFGHYKTVVIVTSVGELDGHNKASHMPPLSRCEVNLLRNALSRWLRETSR